MAQARLDLTNKRDAHIDQRLRSDIIVWLSTVRPDSRPHTAAVWFLWDSEHILIFSQPNQKVRNLHQNPSVVLALDNTHGGDDVITIEGTAELLDNPALTTALPAYVAKYGDHIADLGWTPESMSQSYSQAIRITPTKLHVIG